MKLGVISDTHGSTDTLSRVVERFVNHHKVDVIIHLGDEHTDINELPDKLPVPVHTVPGIYHKDYLNPKVSNRKIVEFNGYKVLLSHTPNSTTHDLPGDLRIDDVTRNREVNAVFYGHKHIPAVELRGSIVWLNPGHLKPSDNRGYPMSYAVTDILETTVNYTIYCFDNDEVLQELEVQK
ncbi:MAG: YfcE family phosphodiesterase [Elusimicrobiota bacterium]